MNQSRRIVIQNIDNYCYCCCPLGLCQRGAAEAVIEERMRIVDQYVDCHVDCHVDLDCRVDCHVRFGWVRRSARIFISGRRQSFFATTF